MNSVLKRVLAILLVLSMLPISVFAADGGAVTVTAVPGTGTMNLTEEGTTDWIHLTGNSSGPYIVHKAVPDDKEITGEILDFMNPSTASGHTFGQVVDQVWRYQTFTPGVSGPLTEVQVALIKKGTPSDLIAALYRMDSKEELVRITVPVEQVPSDEALTLDFGEISVEAGVTYAIALTQTTLNEYTNHYWWCASSTGMESGKIIQDGSWVKESTEASIRIVVGDGEGAAQKTPVGIIDFELLGQMAMTASFNDSAVAYEWSDGVEVASCSGYTTGGVMQYQNGQYTGTLEEEAGWKLTIPASGNMQRLVFVSGVWHASTEVAVYANGEKVYTNSVSATNPSTLLTYTLYIAPNTAVEVVGTMTAKTNVWGNVTLGGVALSDISSVSLDKTDISLPVGSTAALTATVAGEGTVTWSSSDESVVTVDQEGSLTAVASGTAYVSATASNGDSASCKVLVYDPDTVSLTELMDAQTYSNGTVSLPYRVYYPSGYDPKGETDYPVLLFLHGAGERGTNNTSHITAHEGLMRQLILRDDCVVIAPQCPSDAKWVNTDWALGSYDSTVNTASAYLNAAEELLQAEIAKGGVDAKRVWVAGISMGGYGVWNLIMNNPRFYAAAIPICGGADPGKAESVKDLPIWTFHGDADATVPVSGTREMVQAIQEAGGTNIQYTEYAGAGHVDCWVKAYAEPDLLPWLYDQKQENLTKSDLPQIYINVTDPNYSAFDLVKGMDYVDCTIEIYDPTGEFDTLVDEGTTIKVRGNTTANGAKKPFNIKLSSKTDILGMGKGKKWSLLANMYDKSLMRNKLVFDFAQDLGLSYVPDSRTVDVWLDGVYNGTYTICEPVEANSTRVDIDVDNGEFLFEREKSRYEEGAVYITTQRYGLRFVMCDPEELTDEQMAQMKALLKEVEDAIATNDLDTIAEKIDVQSFVDMYIIEEYFKDVDADYSSAKYYFKNGILYCGPVWDFDLSAGNCSVSDYKEYNNASGSGNSYEGYYANNAIWFKYLLKNDEFFQMVKDRYAQLQPAIVNLYEANELGESRMDQMLALCGESFEANWKVWNVSSKDSSAERIPDSTFEANVAYLRSWLSQRNQWMLESYGLNYDITCAGNTQGTVELSKSTATQGEQITVRVTTAAPSEYGMRVAVDGMTILTEDGTEVTCTAGDVIGNGDGTFTYVYTFTMPASNVGIEVRYLTVRDTQVAKLAEGYSGDLTWILYEDGVLTFSGQGKMRNYGSRYEVPWNAYRALVTAVVIPEGVTRVSPLTFVDMVNLENVMLPGTITEIGDYAFKNCVKLTSVALPASLTKLGDSAFYGCTGLTGIEIPGGVTRIGAYAFKKCSSLADLTLTSGLVTVGDSAFYGIAATEIVIPETVETVGAYAFARAGLTGITFTGNAPAIGADAFNMVKATARYPGGNATWTTAVRKNYGGILTWIAG